MRAMLDIDIPLNAGCLVPLTSESPVGSWCIILRVTSPDSEEVIAVTFANSGGLRWQCPDFAADR